MTGQHGVRETEAQPISDVVESLGMGYAQLLVLLLGAGGVFLVEGIFFAALSAITSSWASDMHLSEGQRHSLATMSFVGLFLGVSLSGRFADLFGRRLPIVLSYAILASSLFLCSVLEGWVATTIAALAAGFGVGFGMPPSIAMLSETSPVKWRMAMRGATAVQYSLGVVMVCLLAAQDDVSLEYLHWRRLLFNASIVIAAYFVLAAAFLPESPVFCATKGFRTEAEYGFRAFAERNGKTISGAYELPDNATTETLSLSEQIKVIFSFSRWYVTLATTFACFCMNLVLYGGMYAGPQIFAATSSVPPAYELMLTTIPAACMNLVSGSVGDYVPRKSVVLLALVICASTSFSTCVGGAFPTPRSGFHEALYQYGTLFSGLGVTLGFSVLFQMAVEIYPATSSATGGALVMGVGRVGAIIAPSLFEFMRSSFGTWQSFFEVVGVCNIVCLMVFILVPSHVLNGEDIDQELAGSQLVLSARKGYSTLTKV